MAFRVRVTPKARPFLQSLPPIERGRLFRCWRTLAANPDVDNATKFDVQRPPWTGRLHHCADGFDSLYRVDDAKQEVRILAVGLSGTGKRLTP
jgi:mRNA-degrading endonuclease RelE of RelBE toxin-antitoxin system